MANLPQKGNTQFVAEAIDALKKLKESTLRNAQYNPFNSLHKSAAVEYQKAIDLMESAVKFRIPKEGDIIADMLSGRSVGSAINDYLAEYKLPFPVITLECENSVTKDHEAFIENNIEYKATIIIAWEDELDVINPSISIMVLNKCRVASNTPYVWLILPYAVKIDYKKVKVDSSWEDFIHPIPFHPSVPLQGYFNDCCSEISTLTQFLIALSCKNVSLKKGFPASISENKKREKKGKAKLNQYYEILIESKFGEKNIKELPTVANTRSTGGTKATHLRRGHIRHYEGKNVWIESTVVNAHKGAATAKTYKVK